MVSFTPSDFQPIAEKPIAPTRTSPNLTRINDIPSPYVVAGAKPSSLAANVTRKQIRVASEGTTPPLLPTPSFFPSSLDDVRLVRNLGGGNGNTVVLQDLKNNIAYIQKSPPDHGQLRAEYFADKIYALGGAPVPTAVMYHPISREPMPSETTQEPIVNSCVLTEFIEGKPLRSYLNKPEELENIKKELQKNFVLDCLLANYDSIGQFHDNVMVTKEGMPYRIDNGASFEYRAQGSKKAAQGTSADRTPWKTWGPEVREIEYMRNSDRYDTPQEIENAIGIYQGITDDEIARQIEEIVTHENEILALLPGTLTQETPIEQNNYKGMMAARIENLKTFSQEKMKSGKVSELDEEKND